MAKIRHVAILSEDTVKLSEFYKTTLGLKEVARQGPSPRPKDGRYAEFRIHDPVGTPVDLFQSGWKS